MSSPRPEIFVSATSLDLGSVRQQVNEALLTLGCVPVEQTNFPPDARAVADMLRARIANCDAVIHVAGTAFGAEPRDPASETPRRSYTQMEFDVARELDKHVYSFICSQDFPYDSHEPEDAARVQLQQEHRERLASGDMLFTPVQTREAIPHEWAAMQEKVADALVAQALATDDGERAGGLLGEAVAAYRSELEVRTRKANAQEWASTQDDLGLALATQVMASPSTDRAWLLGEAIEALGSALEIWTAEAHPKLHSERASIIATLKAKLAKLPKTPGDPDK